MIRSALGRRAELVLYVLAAVSYIGTALLYKGVLNWVVGPLWVVVWLEVGSRVATWRARRRGGVSGADA